MVAADSPDLWVRPDEFMFDVSLGVPPDDFSATGQDWGLPTYCWPRMVGTEYAWLRQRARRMAALYDGYRVDHLVGFYRTYGRPAQGDPFFSPPDEPSQTSQGEAILRIFMEGGGAIVAEDLGLVPDFVRDSLARLGVPGCKVLRWERAWHEPGQPFLDPAAYADASAALTGTHDTDTLAVWWDAAGDDERRACLAQPSLAAAGFTDPAMRWTSGLRDAMLGLAYAAGSRELFIPVQDVFGWPDRVNVPGTVGVHNWTWRLPWFVDDLPEIDEARERARFCRDAARRTGRGPE
jgi:4-alpha-glucanotransferase